MPREIKTRCPRCSEPITVPPATEKVQCGKCGAAFRVKKATKPDEPPADNEPVDWANITAEKPRPLPGWTKSEDAGDSGAASETTKVDLPKSGKPSRTQDAGPASWTSSTKIGIGAAAFIGICVVGFAAKIVFQTHDKQTAREEFPMLMTEAESLKSKGKYAEAYERYEKLNRIAQSHPDLGIDSASIRNSMAAIEGQAKKQRADQEAEIRRKAEEAEELARQKAAAAESAKQLAKNAGSTADVVALAEKGVCVVKSRFGVGTGFLVGSKNTLATNAHVIELSELSDLEFIFPACGKETITGAKLMYFDPDVDLALLRLDNLPKGAVQLQMDKTAEFRKGEEVVIIGNPGVGNDLVLENAVTKGLLSTTTEIEGRKLWQVSASINPGNSGGPILSSQGRVLGVAVAKAKRQEGIAFAIPSSTLRDAVDKSSKMSTSEVERVRSLRRVRLVYEKIDLGGRLAALILGEYKDAWFSAIRNDVSVESRVNRVRDSSESALKSITELTSDLRKIVDGIKKDSNLESDTKSLLLDLWANYEQLRDYADNPRGSYNSFSKRIEDLIAEREGLMAKLKVRLGL